MTQTQRPPLAWLIDLPKDDITGFPRASMTSACYGQEKIGEVLGFFVYEASRQAQHDHLDITSPSITSVDITC
jgi:hypothetical protein